MADPEDLVSSAPDDPWAQALRDAPRHLFVPDVAWTTDHGLIDREYATRLFPG